MSVWTGSCPGKLNILAILNLSDKLNSMAFLSMFTPYWPLPLLTTFPSMNSWTWHLWRTLRKSEIKICPWIPVPFADWSALSSLEKPSWKHYRKLIFKLAIPRPFNETINLMSVTCFWHVKSGNLYVLLNNISSVKWIYRHKTCCFIDITCHDPLMPHWSTELGFWPSDWTGNHSESGFLCAGNEKQKERKKASLISPLWCE